MPVSLESDLAADAPADSSTGFALSIGGSAQGSIATPGDSDFLAIDLVAGETYCFALVAIGTTPLIDPILRLYGPDGLTLLALNDNGLVNGNAVFNFTATTSGRVCLAAASIGGTTGDYALSASLGTKAHFDAQMIAGILDSHANWSDAPASGAVLSYGFAATSTQGLPGFQPFSEAQKETMRSLLAHFSDCANLTFSEGSSGYSDEAVLLYGNYHDPADSAAATGTPPGDTAFAAAAGDVWVNTDTPLVEAAHPGSAYYRVILQELARSLGLGEPGLYNASGPAANYDNAAQFWQDSRQFTVMSAFAASDPTGADLPAGIGGSALEPDTLGLFDILALQQIYGANTTVRTGDDAYGFGSNLGGVYDFDQNLDPMLTIWDAGGQDTLDLWRYSADQVIDLEAGHQSSVGGYVNNLGIAYGSTIEAAKGGRGDDRLSGNAAANALYGNQGADLISGGAGNDSLYGSAGSDTLIGGLGADVLWGEESLPNLLAPPTFQLISTAAAGASLTASDVGFFQDQNFTLELIWQQQGLGDPGEMMRFGNLSLLRDAAGQLSVLFAGAPMDGWLPGVLHPALIDGTPHRLSMTYTDMEGRFCLYLDGVKTFERIFLQNTRGLDSTSGILIADQAAIGDIRIFNAERSAADIWQWAWASLPDPVNTNGLQHNWIGDGSGGLANPLPSQPDMLGTGATEPVTVSFQSSFVGNTLYGGEGDDLYHVFSSLDSLIELAGQGTDRLMAHASFALAAGQAVEVLIAAANSGGITLTGNALANSFYSNAAHADTLAGGAGNDVYTLYHAGDRVIEAPAGGSDRINAYANHSLAAGSEVEAIYALGNAGRALTGNALANSFYSNAAFADTLAGGAGNDTYSLYHTGDRVIEAVAGGSDRINAYANHNLAAGSEVEAIYALGNAGRALTGNALANSFYSNAAHADTLAGGAGNDVYTLYHAGDRVIEAPAGGSDRINAYANHSLAAGSEVEAIYALGNAGRALTGNALANSFYSNAAHADTLAGGAGNDRYWINNATDRVIEAASGGFDVIYTTASYTLGSTVQVEQMRVLGAVGLKLTGNGAANTLYGGVKADSLLGGLGADRLVGGGGRDLLYGGADSSADLFIFNSPNESSLGSGRDLVYEFVSGRDKIDLHLIDANATAAGNQTFAFAGYSAQAYAVWLVKTTSQLVLRLDVTGDSRADMEIGLVGLTSAQKADFLL